MPRCARIKSPSSIYHIMIRSISEVKLFKTDEDKIRYMGLLKKYQALYYFKVYAYCLMNNHAHFIIDANGADISKIMHSINFSYAIYFNRVHKRNGHLFQDRFKSKVVNNQRYLYTLTAYIHNNPSDIKNYKGKPEKYRFSSLNVYLSAKKDPFMVLDLDFIKAHLICNMNNNYLDFVKVNFDLEEKSDIEFFCDPTKYISSKKPLTRNLKVDRLIDFICEKANIERRSLYIKYCRSSVQHRALLTILMRSFCDLKCSDICRTLGNITQSRVSALSKIGLHLISSDEKYQKIINDFFEEYVS